MIIDRLVTLLDFKIDQKTLEQYKNQLRGISGLTQKVARNVNLSFKGIKGSVASSGREYRNLSASIRGNITKLRSLRNAFKNAHADNVPQIIREIVATKAQIREQIKLRSAAMATFKTKKFGSKANELQQKKAVRQLKDQRRHWRLLGSTAGRTLSTMGHRISRTASVLIRFRNLLGISIAGALGLRATGSVVQAGFDVEKTELALGSFGGAKGETAEQKKARIKVARKQIDDIALATPFGIKEVEDVFLNLTRRGINAGKYTKGIINTAAKFGGEKDDIKRALIQLGQGFAKNKLDGRDVKFIRETRLPINKALAAVLGEKGNSELDNLAIVDKAITEGKVNREVLNKVFEFFNEEGAKFELDQVKLASFQVNQLGDFLEKFKRSIAESGFSQTIATIVGDINKRFFVALKDGTFAEYAKKISDFLSKTAKWFATWLESLITNLIAGTHWTQKLANAFGGFGNMITVLVSLGLVRWLWPVIAALRVMLPLMIALSGGFWKMIGVFLLVKAAINLVIKHFDWLKDNLAAVIVVIGLATAAFFKFRLGAAGIATLFGPLGLLAAGILIIADNWDIAGAALQRFADLAKKVINTITLGIPEFLGESLGQGAGAIATGNTNALEPGKFKAFMAGIGVVGRFFGSDTTLGLSSAELLARNGNRARTIAGDRGITNNTTGGNQTVNVTQNITGTGDAAQIARHANEGLGTVLAPTNMQTLTGTKEF